MAIFPPTFLHDLSRFVTLRRWMDSPTHMPNVLHEPLHVGLRLACAIFVFGCLLPSTSIAQDEDAEDTDTQQLPEIAPREIEIRGELQLSFPSLVRQPLEGFAPSTTVPSVPDDRMPYVAPYKQELNDLPDSLPAPKAVSQSETTVDTPKQGFLEFGAGRYVSRFGEARLRFPLGAQQTVLFHTDYSGSRGFSPFSGTDVTTPYDAADGVLRFESRHDPVTVAADLHGTVDNYTLYGIPAVRQDSSAVPPSRTGYSGGMGLEIQSFRPVESTVRFTLDRTQYNTQMDPTAQASTNAFQETRMAIDGSATFPIGPRSATLDAGVSRSSFAGDVPESSGYAADGGLTLRLVDTPVLSVDAGGHGLAFSAPKNPSQLNSGTAQASFVVPRGRVDLSIASKLTVYAENSPALQSTGLNTLYTHVPYAEHAPSLRPSLFTTKAETGAIVSLGALRIQPVVGYDYAPSYRYAHSPDPTDPTSTEPLQVDYGSARIARGGAELGLQGVQSVEASVGLFMRDGELIGQDTDIPYLSPLITDAMLSVSFADQRGFIEISGTIESPRPTNLTDNFRVDTYTSFDVEGSYELSTLLDLVVRINNVSPGAHEKWAGYVRPPASIMGGFRIHW